MTKNDKILKMFQMQEKLNNDTNGPEWKKGISSNGKPINWRRAIWLEAAEAVESFPWKHWKDINGTVDRENVKVETVDIWHFGMSEVLANMAEDSVEKIVSDLEAMGSFSVDGNIDKENLSENERQMRAFENMAAEAFSSRSEYSLVNTFFELCDSVDLSVDKLYSMYMSKNMLNSLRQELGYQEGTYQKEWIYDELSPMPVEDNKVILHMFRENPDMPLDQIKSMYTDRYTEATQQNSVSMKP